MNCQHCQQELLASDRFCPNCGAPVSAPAAVAAHSPTPPQPAQPDTGPAATARISAGTAAAPPPHAGARQSVNVTVNTPIVLAPPAGPGCLVRAVWYLCVGWWLAGWAIVLGYVAMVTVIGLPLAFWLFDRVPTLLTLRPRTLTYVAETRYGVTFLKATTLPQLPLWQRALWFVCVGWWATLLWLALAYALSLLILPLPLAIMMYDRIGGVMTLHRH